MFCDGNIGRFVSINISVTEIRSTEYFHNNVRRERILRTW